MADDTTETDSDTDDTAAQNLLADAISDDTGTDTGPDDKDWRAEYERLNKDLDKWKGLARKHEGRARENASAAAKAKSVEEQIAELRTQLADRDVAYVEANGKRAMSQVYAALAESGIKREDAAGLLGVLDPTTLLKDGEPDEDAINKLAGALTNLGGRVRPDFDQGRKGGNAPPNMNDLIRRAAGISTR